MHLEYLASWAAAVLRFSGSWYPHEIPVVRLGGGGGDCDKVVLHLECSQLHQAECLCRACSIQ